MFISIVALMYLFRCLAVKQRKQMINMIELFIFHVMNADTLQKKRSWSVSKRLIFYSINTSFSGTDAGFPVGGGANPPGGRQHMILPNFAKNCMKLRKFWAVGRGAPLNPPLLLYSFNKQKKSHSVSH